jgi:hypothetical protein
MNDRHPVILNIDAPRSPDYLLEVAEAFAEAPRVMNHQTRHHEALEYPSEADRLVRELSSAAGRLPQLLDQVAAWLEQEAAAGRIEVPSGEWAGVPGVAVVAVRLRADYARGLAEGLQEALDSLASVTCQMAAAETGEGGSDDDR